jgi:hypothetical protein
MIPQHCGKPPHSWSTRLRSGEIGRNTATGSIDGMANAALLVTIKQCGAFLGFADNVRCAARNGRGVAQLYKDSHH